LDRNRILFLKGKIPSPSVRSFLQLSSRTTDEGRENSSEYVARRGRWGYLSVSWHIRSGPGKTSNKNPQGRRTHHLDGFPPTQKNPNRQRNPRYYATTLPAVLSLFQPCFQPRMSQKSIFRQTRVTGLLGRWVSRVCISWAEIAHEKIKVGRVWGLSGFFALCLDGRNKRRRKSPDIIKNPEFRCSRASRNGRPICRDMFARAWTSLLVLYSLHHTNVRFGDN